MNKHTYVGVASPTQNDEIIKPENQEVSVVHGVNELSEICERRQTSRKPDNQEVSVVHGAKKICDKRREFDEYLNEKLAHLKNKERRILEPVLRRYCLLFYGIGSSDIGCTSQVQHAIETGDARPIKRNPYRIPMH